mmetsp:Transcript_25154/g.65628  ORF Transcript_25154/g.65628 Transcript_25154/m.65628 type:complete len:292 (-) Transcript_25154:278-1153(-)|eukprot:CAMPEP_0182917648 /NCGR_PEP_ID=MMETSP0105_2-20130417/1637_1 /TAXON_ID=81532 ORGANISM="Acanthoeca-like sp., Strain 10tr" /NCGR_SAMPLE_ID=MMETSP0105_2 /ASSEMBLY_ACC=CAM_ASM_000205 /LENGTH=291 /DNA_ID=CAMNT_0025054663 /DNA_START=219 /DNA_END=1094 /DNA_ORIENTATION=+
MAMRLDDAGPAVDESDLSQMATEGTQAVNLFSARLEDVQSIVSILRTIGFAQEAACEMSEAGLKFTVEHHKALEAKAFFQESLFKDFHFGDRGESTSITVNLGVLLECLSIFGSSPSATLKMSYVGYGSPLVLLLEDEGVLTDCSVRTSEPSDPLGIEVRQTEIPGNIIMKSHWLAEVFAEFDPTSESVEIVISPDKPFFRLSTRGSGGSTHVDCPKDSDLIESFTCGQTMVYSYSLKLLKPTEKALAISSRISIRMNAFGTMSIQFLVEADNGHVTFIEFLLLPLDDSID